MSGEKYLLSLWAETKTGERFYPYTGARGPKKGLYSVSFSGKSNEYVGVLEKDLIAAIEAGEFAERGTIRMLSLNAKPGSERSGFAPTHYFGEKISKIKQTRVRALPNVRPLFPEEIPEGLTYAEGTARKILVNSYERSTAARDSCIKYYGAVCAVCAIDFGSVYGEIGAGFIHVHHTTLISAIGAEYKIDPIKDLVPVCPNCHAMIHRSDPPLQIEILKALIQTHNISLNRTPNGAR